MRFFTLLLMGLFVFPVQATTKVNVFSVEVMLDTNDAEAETKARSEGLKNVIVRASGEKNVADNAIIKKALRSSSKYLSQIGYGEQSGNPTLKMVFNPPQIQSLLTQAQLPYWSDERANLAVWVVEENRRGREILWEQSESPFINQLRYYAALRGLPVTVPVGDFEDVTGIAPTDLWGGFLEPLSNVTKRYPVDAVLVLRVHKMGSKDGIRWSLYDSKPEMLTSLSLQPVSGTQVGQTAQALEKVIDEVTNYYAQKSAVKRTGESSESVLADFIGISSANSFFVLEKQLKQMQSVAFVEVVQVVGQRVTFRVNLLASDAEFENELIQNSDIKKIDREFTEAVPQLDVVPSDNVETGITPYEGSSEANTVSAEEKSDLSSGSELSGISENSLIYEWLR
ncbi:DUF2066 domain-containing protein [Vibrio sp. JC009]|uniref:DUF2066 domain-containing protein n=1 Tax=Vibrio sp. JC009 TaxID=2912314 RepID=UPI0023B02F09|nr:DUF2066 domain-containing protein [Vibrio sp. JC009]WED21146.1 DUF2066 domain-containing protein [Vibrio sp. JC009]